MAKPSWTERAVIIQSGSLALDGLWIPAPGIGGDTPHIPVLLCHPHPMHGGSMASPLIVETAFQLAKRGVPNLRFNMRGTGASQGQFDNGPGEIEDALAALEWLAETTGEDRLDIVGYSFGAYAAAHVAARSPRIRKAVLVAPPVRLYDFTPIVRARPPFLIIAGERDTLCPPQEMRTAMSGLDIRYEFQVIRHADHFFGFQLLAVGHMITRFLDGPEGPAGSGP